MNIDTNSIKKWFHTAGSWLGHYRILLFFVLLAAVYGFLVFRINSLNSAQPTDSSVASKAQSFRNPHIDSETVQKIQQLQDNSVNVQALFDQARQNPFQE